MSCPPTCALSLSLSQFTSLVQAIGLPTKACSTLFDEFDTTGSGQLSYADFLHFFLRDALGRAAIRVTDLCREIDREGPRLGIVGKDEFRLAVRRLGWEVPSTYVLDAIFISMDPQGRGQLTFNELCKMLRTGTAEDLADELHRQRYTNAKAGHGNVEVQAKNRMPVRRGSLAEQYEANLALWYPRMPKRDRRDSFDGAQPTQSYGRRRSMAAPGLSRRGTSSTRRNSVFTPPEERSSGGGSRRVSVMVHDDPLANAVGDPEVMGRGRGRRTSVATQNLRKSSISRPLPPQLQHFLMSGQEHGGAVIDVGTISLPSLSPRDHARESIPAPGSLSARTPRLPVL